MASGFSQGSTPAPSYVPGTFTPTVTLVGGAGNTVPVYSTNTGRYTQIGNQCFVDIYLTGDGGNEGAGSGVINIALPITAGASHPAGNFLAGSLINGSSQKPCYGVLTGGATTVALKMQGDTAGALIDTNPDVTGNNQNNATRSIRMKFFYEV